MGFKLSKLKGILQGVKIGVAVGKTIITPDKPSKTFNKIEQGEQIAEKVFEIIDLLRKK